MRISIITVSYNSGNTIRDTIESVLRQTYANIEYIVVDGASTDNTVEIIKEYEPRFEGRLKWLSEKDNGLYAAMNKGIRMATGDVVGILNSDDFYHREETIAIIAKTMITSGVSAVYGDCCFVKGDNLEKVVRYYRSKNFSVKRFRFGFMPCHPTFFAKKESFERYGYYKEDYKIAADFELLVRFLYSNKLKTEYIPLDFLKMRTGGVSTASYKSNLISIKEIVRACKENEIWTCRPFLFLKYFLKIWEFVIIPNREDPTPPPHIED